MKKLLSIILSCCVLLQSFIILTFAGNVLNVQENLIYNPELNFTYNGSTYSVDGWSLPSIATVTEGADGYNVVTIATSNTNKEYALRSTNQLNLDTDKYYKFSIMYKLEDPPSGNFNINNKVFLTYKYNNTYVNRGQLTKNTDWTQASFIMYGGDVTEGAWDKFFAVVSNYSRCTLSVKKPSVTVYDSDILEYINFESENILSNGDLSAYNQQTNEIENLLIEGKTMPWYGGHSVETVNIGGVTMNALRFLSNIEGNDRRIRMNFDNNLISKDEIYKFTAWIKIEDNSTTGTFDNNSGSGAIKLCFHHGNDNDFGTVKYLTKTDWQKIELIIDTNLHGGRNWWSDPSSNNYFGVGINVYNMNCDILLADLKLEATPPINISATEPQNGRLEINRTTAQIGDNIEVLAEANSGYKLNRLYYTDGSTQTDITTKKQTVAVSETRGGHNATTYTSVASDILYSFSISTKGNYTVIAEFVDENDQNPEGGGGGNEPEPSVPSETPSEGTYLNNYDFEAYSQGKVVSWNEGNFGTATTQSYSTTAHGGDYALRIDNTNRNGVPMIVQPIKAFDATKLYRIGVFVKTISEMDRAYDGGGIKVRVSYTSGGNTANISSSGYKTLEEWTEISTLFQLPQDATNIKAVVILDCIAGSVLIDDMTVTEVGDALENEDGKFKNGGFETYIENEFIGWNFYNGGNGENSVTQDTGRTGKAAVLRDTNTDHIMNLSQSVTLDRTKQHQISVYVKSTYDDITSFYVPSWGGAYLEYTAGDYTVTSELITTSAPYKKVSIVVDGSKIPENTNGTVKFVMKYMRGIIYLDDAEITEYTGDNGPDTEETVENLYNTSFEEGSGDVFEYWTKNTGSNISLISSNTAYDSNRAVKAVSTNRNAVGSISQAINNLNSDKRYLLSVWVKQLTELDYAYTGAGVKLSVTYTLNGSNVSAGSVTLREMEDWSQLKLYFQIPQNAEKVTAKITFDCFKGEVLADKVTLTEIGNAVEKVDGQFANGGFEEYYDGQFAEWNFYDGGNSENSVTQADGRTGKAAVLRDTNTDHIMNLSQTVTLDRTKKYLISVYAKTTYDDNTSFYVPSWGGAYLEYTAGDYTVTSELITTSAPYKKLSIVVDGSKIPENTNGTVKFVMKYMRGIIYLDDATITEYNGENLDEEDTPDIGDEEPVENLYNTSFEEGTGDVLEYWTKAVGKDIKIVASNTAYDKDRAVKAVSTNRNAVGSISQAINNLDSTKRYLLSVWVKQLTELDYSYTGAGVKLSVTYTLNGSSVTAGSVTLKEMKDWTQLKLYFQVPQNAEKVTAKITFDCFKGEALVDCVSLSETGKAVEKSDGQFANGGFEEYYDGQFAEWTFYDGGNSDNSVTQEDGRTGKAAVLRDTNTDHIMNLSQNVVLDRSKTYKISLFLRATSDDDTSFYVPTWGGAYLQLQAGDYTVVSETITSTCRYRQLSLIVDASKLPEGTIPKVSFVMKYMRGIIYLDDAKIEIYDGTQKDEPIVLDDLYNLSFEEGKNNSFEDWNKSVGKNVEIQATTSVHHEGSRAVKIVSTDRNAVAKLYQNINNVDVTKRYRITVWAKTDDKVDVAYDGGGIKLQVTYTDSDGKTQSSTSAPRRTLDEWTQLYVDYQIPEGAKNVRVNLVSDCLKGIVYYDDMAISVIGKAVVMPKADPLNLAPNFSFENGQGGSFPGWYWWTNNSKNTCEIGEPHLGAQSAKVTSNVADSSAQLSWDTTSIENSGWYQFSAWVKTEDIVPLSAGNGGAVISIQFKKDGSNTSLKVYRSKYLVGTNGWTQLIVIGKFPEGCKRVVFALALSQATGTVYWDDIDIRKIEYTDTNLIKNGNFDEADDDGNLKYWEKETDDWSFASFGFENNIATVNNVGICSSYYYQEIEELIYGEEYVISGKVSADSVVTENGGAAAILEMIDVYGNIVERKRCNEYLSGTSQGATEFNVKFALSENCKKVRIVLACDKAAGTAGFSEFRLVSLNEFSGGEALEPTILKHASNFAENNITPVADKEKSNLIPIIIAVSIVAVLGVSGLVTITVIKGKKTK